MKTFCILLAVVAVVSSQTAVQNSPCDPDPCEAEETCREVLKNGQVESECYGRSSSILATRRDDVCTAGPRLLVGGSTGGTNEPAFCGRGPNRIDCPTNYFCETAANDAYAMCCPSVPLEKEKCSLPKAQGPCEAYFPSYYYNSETKECEIFVYGGCQGNDNRFKQQEDCEEACKDKCELPSKTGSCDETLTRYYYDSEAEECRTFIYSNCDGNENNFETMEKCEKACAPAPDRCSFPKVSGMCMAYFERYFYNTSAKQCQQFVYGGCGGNDNSFMTEDECKQACPEKPGECPAPPEGGVGVCAFMCNDDNGCQGTQKCCANACGGTVCLDPVAPPATCENVDCNDNQRCEMKEVQCIRAPCNPVPTCVDDEKPGECPEIQNGTFGVCGGDICDNDFYCSGTQKCCRNACGTPLCTDPVIDVCELPSDSGPCRASFRRYYYDAEEEECMIFTYGGCQGNDNNFETKEACEKQCKSEKSGECPEIQNGTFGVCGGDICDDDFYCSGTQKCCPNACGTPLCTDPVFTCKTMKCSANQRCEMKEVQCFRAPCPPVPECVDIQDVCALPRETGPCRGNFQRYYFDAKEEECMIFTYGGCKGNDNNFETKEACEKQCVTDKCSLPKASGPCRAYMPSYYYDAQEKQCKDFVYGGCEGNDNRFVTKKDCEAACVPDRCSQPKAPGPCEAYMPSYYYDAQEKQCKDFVYGGCQGNDNRFVTKEDCEEACPSEKPGECPVVEKGSVGICGGTVCREDSDCSGRQKCCHNACGPLCTEPVATCKTKKCGVLQRCEMRQPQCDQYPCDPQPTCVDIEVKEGRCPAYRPGLSEDDLRSCSEECEDDVDCKEGKKCCETACGGTYCAEPYFVSEGARATGSGLVIGLMFSAWFLNSVLGLSGSD